MKKVGLVLWALAVLGIGAGLRAQLTADEQAAYDKWEDFLRTAKVVDQEQITGLLAVTNPWVLTLEKDGVRHKAVWKDIFGERVGGFKETWKGEIAAYRLSRALGLNMVPVTIEREFQGNRGSCQVWFEAWNTMETIIKKKLNPPGIKQRPGAAASAAMCTTATSRPRSARTASSRNRRSKRSERPKVSGLPKGLRQNLPM